MNFAKAETRGEVLIRLALLAKVGLVFAFAFYRPFVVDEFWQAGQAKYLFNELYDTIWPAKAAGYAVFYKIAHLAGWDTASTMLIARGMTAAMGCATLFIVYQTARCLGADRVKALLILLVLLSFSNFAERIFRTRAEPAALFFAACALLVIVRSSSINARSLFFAGVLSGCAFLTTQKAVYFNVALGLGLVADALWRREIVECLRRGGALVAGWIVPVILFSLVFGGSNALAVAHSIFFGPQEVALSGHAAYANGLRGFVWATLKENAILYLLAAIGMGLAVARYRAEEAGVRVGIVFSLVITALVFAHNQPWPYVFIMALPFMALWSCDVFDLPDRYRVLKTAAKILLILGVALSFFNNIVYFRYSNYDQLETVKRAEALLAPDETYFDGIGMIVTRRESPRAWLDARGIQIALSSGEGSELVDGFRTKPPKVVIQTSRSRAIEPLIADILGASYTRLSPNVLIAGRTLQRGVPEGFTVPISGRYALYDTSGQQLTADLLLDGMPVTQTVELSRGKHTLELASGPEVALLLPASDYSGKVDLDAEERLLFFAQYD